MKLLDTEFTLNPLASERIGSAAKKKKTALGEAFNDPSNEGERTEVEGIKRDLDYRRVSREAQLLVLLLLVATGTAIVRSGVFSDDPAEASGPRITGVTITPREPPSGPGGSPGGEPDEASDFAEQLTAMVQTAPADSPKHDTAMSALTWFMWMTDRVAAWQRDGKDVNYAAELMKLFHNSGQPKLSQQGAPAHGKFFFGHLNMEPQDTPRAKWYTAHNVAHYDGRTKTFYLPTYEDAATMAGWQQALQYADTWFALKDAHAARHGSTARETEGALADVMHLEGSDAVLEYIQKSLERKPEAKITLQSMRQFLIRASRNFVTSVSKEEDAIPMTDEETRILVETMALRFARWLALTSEEEHVRYMYGHIAAQPEYLAYNSSGR